MSISTPQPDTEIARAFALHWMLSLVVPAVVLALIGIFMGGLFGSVYFSLLLVFLFWLAAGHTQSDLLIRRLPRRRLWMIVTCVGGSVGFMAGMAVQYWIISLVTAALSSAGAPPGSGAYWIGLLSISIAGMVGGAILGFLQAMCLDGPRHERILWLIQSAACGCLAAWAASLSGDAVTWLLSGAAPGSYEAYRAGVSDIYWRPFVMTVAGLSVFGILTGRFLRSLILRRAQLRKELLVRQFD